MINSFCFLSILAIFVHASNVFFVHQGMEVLVAWAHRLLWRSTWLGSEVTQDWLRSGLASYISWVQCWGRRTGQRSPGWTPTNIWVVAGMTILVQCPATAFGMTIALARRGLTSTTTFPITWEALLFNAGFFLDTQMLRTSWIPKFWKTGLGAPWLLEFENLESWPFWCMLEPWIYDHNSTHTTFLLE